MRKAASPTAYVACLQVKAQCNSLRQEIAAASRQRELWHEQQAAAEHDLATKSEEFERLIMQQVGIARAGWA